MSPFSPLTPQLIQPSVACFACKHISHKLRHVSWPLCLHSLHEQWTPKLIRRSVAHFAYKHICHPTQGDYSPRNCTTWWSSFHIFYRDFTVLFSCFADVRGQTICRMTHDTSSYLLRNTHNTELNGMFHASNCRYVLLKTSMANLQDV